MSEWELTSGRRSQSESFDPITVVRRLTTLPTLVQRFDGVFVVYWIMGVSLKQEISESRSLDAIVLWVQIYCDPSCTYYTTCTSWMALHSHWNRNIWTFLQYDWLDADSRVQVIAATVLLVSRTSKLLVGVSVIRKIGMSTERSTTERRILAYLWRFIQPYERLYLVSLIFSIGENTVMIAGSSRLQCFASITNHLYCVELQNVEWRLSSTQNGHQ